MNKKLFCIFMPTTFEIDTKSNLFVHGCLTENEKRINQYKEGINQFILFNNPNIIDIYISDNSLFFTKETKYKDELIRKNLKIITKATNKYGGINKGAGIIENWEANIDILERYDYVIHFEPRQMLIYNFFINSFVKNPRNMFTLGTNKKHFNTGLFMIKTGDLINFIKKNNPIDLVDKHKGLEYALFDFVNDNNISYDIFDHMYLLWYDSFFKKIKLM